MTAWKNASPSNKRASPKVTLGLHKPPPLNLPSVRPETLRDFSDTLVELTESRMASTGEIVNLMEELKVTIERQQDAAALERALRSHPHTLDVHLKKLQTAAAAVGGASKSRGLFQQLREALFGALALLPRTPAALRDNLALGFARLTARLHTPSSDTSRIEPSESR